MLTKSEQKVAERTEESIRALRVESRRRLEAEAKDKRVTKRRLKNVLRAYEEQHATT
ncbi:MAG: hypothetical protein ACTH2Q_01600 [Propionibacteriaceae bacterium]